MILSVSRYVAEKEELRRQQELALADEKLQAAAQALVLQAREIANAEDNAEATDEASEAIATEALQTLEKMNESEKQSFSDTDYTKF